MYKIKKIPRSDIREYILLIKGVFDYFIAPDYSKDGVQSFYNYINYNQMIKRYREDNYRHYGAYYKGRIIGVIETRDNNHICLLFTHKDFQRQGIARTLIDYEFKDYSGDLTVNASPYASVIYEKLGFEKVSGEIVRNGITFIPMIKSHNV